jgi:hypothetical protein
MHRDKWSKKKAYGDNSNKSPESTRRNNHPKYHKTKPIKKTKYQPPIAETRGKLFQK